jgi:hypothetical protein
MRIFGLAALVLAVLASGGCLVLALNPIYDDQTIEFDEKLLGTWDRAEDRTSVVIARGPWRSYDVTYEARGTTLKLAAYGTRIGDARFLDAGPEHGIDLVPLAVPAHLVLRVQLVGDTLTVGAFDYDWWMRAAEQGELKKLGYAIDERKNVVLTAPTSALREWIAGSPRVEAAYDDPLTFTRRR